MADKLQIGDIVEVLPNASNGWSGQLCEVVQLDCGNWPITVCISRIRPDGDLTETSLYFYIKDLRKRG